MNTFISNVIDFFKSLSLWEKVAAGVIAAIILGAWRWLKPSRPKSSGKKEAVIRTGEGGISQAAAGEGIKQDLIINKPSSDKGTVINVMPGAQPIINVNYTDGLPNADNPKVRELFEKAWEHYKRKEYYEAIRTFTRCLGIERDNEKRGALNLLIGNCYYQLRLYVKAAESYEAGLAESRKAGDLRGEASNLAGMANAYMLMAASSGEERGQNVRKAVKHYGDALSIFKKDKYPVEYALTQNNLGFAYTDLPAATPEEWAENIRKGVDCYNEALKVRRKDEYPVEYAMTQNNLGLAYTDLPVGRAEEQTENIRKAVDCYNEALKVYRKDEYPVEYAATQNNLGLAYTDLPVATPEERAENIRKAVDCYKEALKVRKKDEYPHYYCQTAANMGIALASIGSQDACYWLKEAYALREYLEDQGRRIEELIEKECKGKP